MSENLIHVQWDGPYTYGDAKKLKDEYVDYGVYQIYGSHPVYGSDVLLYLGKAGKRTFGTRLSEEYWWERTQDSKRLTIYVGRLHGFEKHPTNDEWLEQITLVERYLIYAHAPASNSSGLNVKFYEDEHPVHILNWGQFRDLLPEVSSARYSSRFDTSENYFQYGEELRPQ
jgi:hypothetical protein